MLFKNSPRGASLSVHYDIEEFKEMVVNFVEDELQKIDPNIRVYMSEGEYDLYLYFEGFNYENEIDPDYSPKTIKKLRQMGFSVDGGDNLATALQMMSPGDSVDYSIDPRVESVIVRSFGQGSEVLNRLDELYQEIGDMNREQAAQQIGLIYKQIKELNWG